MPTFYALVGESDDYQINFVSSLSGESVSAYAWYSPPGLSAVGSATGSATIEVRLSGGSAGSSYLVSGEITTNDSGRRLIEYFTVSVGWTALT